MYSSVLKLHTCKIGAYRHPCGQNFVKDYRHASNQCVASAQASHLVSTCVCLYACSKCLLSGVHVKGYNVAVGPICRMLFISHSMPNSLLHLL